MLAVDHTRCATANSLAARPHSSYAKRFTVTRLSCYAAPCMPAEITTLLGAGTRFEGKLAFEGNVRIEGEFRGTIYSPDVLIIGEGAQVYAELEVGTLIMRGGELVGNVTATTAIEIHAPARVRGDLHAPSLFIDKGVAFEGRCRMDAVSTESAAEPSAASPTEATPAAPERALDDSLKDLPG
jgi:cytoskeletal protein CcmA (bactofilin family)